jgi:hypothetical protein
LSTAEITAKREVRILLIGETLAAGGIVARRTGSQLPAPAVVEKLRMRVDIVDGPRKAA